MFICVIQEVCLSLSTSAVTVCLGGCRIYMRWNGIARGQDERVILYKHGQYLLTPWSRVVLEKLIGCQLVKKFPALYGSRRFITAVTSARHLSLFWATSIQSVPSHPTSWRSILILFFHLLLSLPSGLFPSGGFTTRFHHQHPVYTSAVPHPCYMSRLPHSSRFCHPKKLGEKYRSLSSSLCSFLHSPVTSSLLGPNILLSILFSNALGLRISLNVCDQVSHPYKATGKTESIEIGMKCCRNLLV